MTNEERRSALLTKSQRNTLRDESDLTDRGKRAARSRIRERTYHGILDSTILWDLLSPNDIRNTFEKWRDTQDEIARGECDNSTNILPETKADPSGQQARDQLEHALSDLIAFVYFGIEESGDFDAETVLTHGVERAEKRLGNDIVADLERSERFNTKRLMEQFQAREELETEEIAYLEQEDEITIEELKKYYSDYFEDVISERVNERFSNEG